MIVEVLEMHETWLKDLAHGAQFYLNSVTRNAGHAAPPALVDIVSVMSDEAAATENGMPANPPCLGMMAQVIGDAPDPAVNREGNGQVEVAIRYLTRQTNAMIAQRDASYTNRGILASLRKMEEGGQEAGRQLRGIQLITRTKCEFQTLYQPLGDGWISGLWLLTYNYRDVGFLP